MIDPIILICGHLENFKYINFGKKNSAKINQL